MKLPNELDAIELGVSQKSLKAAANTVYPTRLLKLSEYLAIFLRAKWTVTGASTQGAISLQALLYDKHDVLMETIDIVTGIDVTATGSIVVQFGRGIDPVLNSANGTLGTFATALRLLKSVKFQAKITTQANAATSNLLDLQLQYEN